MSQQRLVGLHWGIKASFMNYMAAMPDSQASAVGGATPTAGNLLVWEPAGSPPSKPNTDLVLAFRGDVRFTGHGGLLSVRLADPCITTRGGEAVLTVLDPSRADPARRLRLACLTLETRPASGRLRIWLSKDVRLAEEGTALFNDVYPAGEQMEPLAIFLPTAPDDEEGQE